MPFQKYIGFPSPDEFNNIIKTREDIERLEQCEQPIIDGSGLINPRDQDSNKECDGKKIADMIKIESIKMSQRNKEKLFRGAIDGIKTLNSYADIAEHIDNKTKLVNWLTFVGAKRAFQGSTKKATSEYLVFVLGELMIQSFTVNMQLTAESDTRTSTTPRSIIKPTSNNRPSSGQTTSPKPEKVLMFTGGPIIVKTDFEDEVNKFIKSKLAQIVNNGETRPHEVCQTIVRELGIQYKRVVKPDLWVCGAGIQQEFAINFASDEVAKMDVNMGSTRIKIIKLPEVKAHRSDWNVILETRANINNVVLNNTDADEQTTQKMILLAQEAVQKAESYAGISRLLQQKCDTIFRRKFHVTIGLDTQYWIYFYRTSPWLVNFRINELRVIIYSL